MLKRALILTACMCIPCGSAYAAGEHQVARTTGIVVVQAPAPLDAHIQIENGFGSFCKSWIATKGSYARTNITCVRLGRQYVAEYTGYADDYEFSIRKTGSRHAPYIGILQYNEIQFQNAAPTADAAMHGPFQNLGSSFVTEIFTYTKGAWQR
ncbi:hypothetical protein ACFL43_04675 [Thermodesulfobacteriota bacterium]